MARGKKAARKESAGNSALSGVERRVALRNVLIVRKMTLAEIIIGETGVPRIHYVYINDISETGIRISSDILFPQNKRIRIRLFLSSPVSIEVFLRWKKEIGIKNYVNGMEFEQFSAINKKGVCDLLRWAEPYFEKTSFLINSTLFMETDLDEPFSKMYIYTLSISQGKMELMNNLALPEGREFELKFSLRHGIPAVTTRGQVIHQKEIAGEGASQEQAKNYNIWIEFLEPAPVKEHLMETLAEHPPARAR
jgi:hypothetical protein